MITTTGRHDNECQKGSTNQLCKVYQQRCCWSVAALLESRLYWPEASKRGMWAHKSETIINDTFDQISEGWIFDHIHQQRYWWPVIASLKNWQLTNKWHCW